MVQPSQTNHFSFHVSSLLLIFQVFFQAFRSFNVVVSNFLSRFSFETSSCLDLTLRPIRSFDSLRSATSPVLATVQSTLDISAIVQALDLDEKSVMISPHFIDIHGPATVSVTVEKPVGDSLDVFDSFDGKSDPVVPQTSVRLDYRAQVASVDYI